MADESKLLEPWDALTRGMSNDLATGGNAPDSDDSMAGGVGTVVAATDGSLRSLEVLLPLLPRALSPVMRRKRCRKA